MFFSHTQFSSTNDRPDTPDVSPQELVADSSIYTHPESATLASSPPPVACEASGPAQQVNFSKRTAEPSPSVVYDSWDEVSYDFPACTEYTIVWFGN